MFCKSSWVQCLFLHIPIGSLVSGILILLFCIWLCRLYIFKKKFEYKDGKRVLTLGFFHPYCNAGGGGERVLWCALRALPQVQPKDAILKVIIYTGDQVDATSILERVKTRFGIEIPLSLQVQFIELKYRYLIEASLYPRFTLLGQSIGSMILSCEALYKYTPDIFIDTTGYAFTFPVAKYCGKCHVIAYVHYPTISMDMLTMVSDRSSSYNNSNDISNSRLKSLMKLIYYHIFAFLYQKVGQTCDLILVNSSWTQNHILKLWKCNEKTFVIFPPCYTKEFQKIDLNKKRQDVIVSIGQFRPEKNHLLQLECFAFYLKNYGMKNVDNNNKEKMMKLILIGSCRDEEDLFRVNELKKKCKELGIESSVDFQLNLSFDELCYYFSIAKIGLHTMWNEHFGIGIVEMMASGIITIAHNSGGPREDIISIKEEKIKQKFHTGYLATSKEEYAEKIHLANSLSQPNILRQHARDSVQRFSDQVFDKQFSLTIKAILTKALL